MFAQNNFKSIQMRGSSKFIKEYVLDAVVKTPLGTHSLYKNINWEINMPFIITIK